MSLLTYLPTNDKNGFLQQNQMKLCEVIKSKLNIANRRLTAKNMTAASFSRPGHSSIAVSPAVMLFHWQTNWLWAALHINN